MVYAFIEATFLFDQFNARVIVEICEFSFVLLLLC